METVGMVVLFVILFPFFLLSTIALLVILVGLTYWGYDVLRKFLFVDYELWDGSQRHKISYSILTPDDVNIAQSNTLKMDPKEMTPPFPLKDIK